MKRTRKPSALKDRPDLLAEVVRTKLLELGDFGHLHVHRQADHFLIEQPGPTDAPEQRYPVLRLTLLGGGLPPHFGLSLRRHSNRWEKIPVSGLLADVLADAVSMFQPWLAAERLMSGTSEMDY